MKYTPVQPPHMDKYIATVTWMHGDADLYTESEIDLGADEGNVHEFIELIRWLRDSDSRRRLGSTQHDSQPAVEIYNHPLFQKYFFEYTEEDFNNDKAAGYTADGEMWQDYVNDADIEVKWPTDKLSNYSYKAHLDRFCIFWYSGQGILFKVEV